MAHVGRETRVALDAVLQRLGHRVERVGEHAEVRVVGGFEAGVEASAGDGLGRLAHVGQRAQGAAPGPEADAGARQRGEHGCAQQRESE